MKPITLLASTLIFTASAIMAATKATSVTRHNITWTFDKEYEIGQFVNGDWWVLGPVKITAITNDLSDKSFLPTDGTAVSGSMVNPIVDTPKRQPGEQAATYNKRVNAHGYDERLNHYNEELNAALPSGKPLSTDNPLILKPSSSLMSVVSWLYHTPADKEPGAPKVPDPPESWHMRPALRAAAVLTVLDKAPPVGSFRPAYAGTEKRMFNVSQIKRDRLRGFAPFGFTSTEAVNPDDPASVFRNLNTEINANRLIRATERVWLDHIPSWWGGEACHPSLNIPNYGREISYVLMHSMLALNLDWTKIEGFTQEQKDQLLINILQIGIDSAGAADAGSFWDFNGGHHAGRKPVILFTGLLLDDKHMKSVGQWDWPCHDNDSVFYVTEEHVALSNNEDRWKPDKRTKIRAPYTKEMIGMPEWGFRPEGINAGWDHPYRSNNAGYIVGFALLFTIMEDGRKLFNHEVYFDYADRILSGGDLLDYRGSYERLSPFVREMWELHRKDYPSTYDKKFDDPKIIEYITTRTEE